MKSIRAKRVVGAGASLPSLASYLSVTTHKRLGSAETLM
jgi:hypothetical protein